MTAVTPAPLTDTRSEPDLVGRRLGDYQILRRLGRGGMAEVYLADHLSLRRQVAIKVLRSTLAGDEAYVRRFHHEAQAAAKLVHTNIVAIHEVGCVDGWHYIAQEYVPGQNLKQLLTRIGHGLAAPQAANILRQVASALHKAAEQNITHRDIKPENIMITAAGEVKVADFGLARVAQAGESLNLTQVGITMGTPLYMSPEQVVGKEVDPRSDLYSLGVTSYHMLASRPPFDGETALAVAVQHLKQEPQRLEDILPEMTPGLCRIVHRLLVKDPKERYQRAIDVLKDLKSLSIPGLDPDWAADLPGWNPGDGGVGMEGRLAATQQLSLALRSQKNRTAAGWLASPLVLLLLLAAAGSAAGAAAAYLARPAPLLALPEGGQLQIRPLGSVQEQYAYAQLAKEEQEAAYLAVMEHWPARASAENERHAWLAKKGLAAYYLASDRLVEAGQLYEELSTLDKSQEPILRLTGIAGSAVVYDRRAKELTDDTPLLICLATLYNTPETELQGIGNTLYQAVSEVMEKHRPAE
jgi:serine/threonine-protein kinase